MWSYRTYLIVVTLAGMVPALAFAALFLLIAPPRRRDRVARLIRDLAILLAISTALPFLLLIIPGGADIPPAPTTWWRWLLNVGVRAFIVVWLWRLLWVYLTPRRDQGRRRAVARDAGPDT